jgi:2,4-dienoyl-CoA reductase-like NADH-dependent reductase (Old Yellow Enzyme family)
MPAHLFSPITIGGLTLPNRVAVSPMCQYSAVDGCANDWHVQHLGSLSVSGAGVLVVEMTAVEPEGRITPACLGLYSDANEAALERVLATCRRWGTAKLGIQIAHAGRKASVHVPWHGGKPLSASAGAWQTVGASPIPFDTDWPTPQAVDRDGIDRLVAAFGNAARRADRLGFDLLELHGAHGYLLHNFVSPISNKRDDEYGGSAENRMRFPLEVAAAVRAVWPRNKALGMRITGSDWIDGGLTAADAVLFASALKDTGFDYVCVSSGGVSSQARVVVEPGYQVPFAETVKRDNKITVQAVGMIVDPHQAEAIVGESRADWVALARGFLNNPRWAWHAADALGAEVSVPPQYLRSRPNVWPGAALARPRQPNSPA